MSKIEMLRSSASEWAASQDQIMESARILRQAVEALSSLERSQAETQQALALFLTQTQPVTSALEASQKRIEETVGRLVEASTNTKRIVKTLQEAMEAVQKASSRVGKVMIFTMGRLALLAVLSGLLAGILASVTTAWLMRDWSRPVVYLDADRIAQDILDRMRPRK